MLVQLPLDLSAASFQINTTTIAVDSKPGPKLNAVTEALQSFSAALARDERFETLGVEVESGVSHTPTSREELMRGARQRAEALREIALQQGAAWQYFVGLEGGLDVVPEGESTDEMLRHPGMRQNAQRRVFLDSWAYVSDGTRGYYGRSGSIELPEALAHDVLENSVELAIAIDRFAGTVGISDAQGAWGVP